MERPLPFVHVLVPPRDRDGEVRREAFAEPLQERCSLLHGLGIGDDDSPPQPEVREGAEEEDQVSFVLAQKRLLL